MLIVFVFDFAKKQVDFGVSHSILMLSLKLSHQRRHKDGLTVYFRTVCVATENETSARFRNVAKVFQKIMKTLYETHFPNAEVHRRGPVPVCPDSDILAVAWLLEYIGEDSERSGVSPDPSRTARRFPNFTRTVAFQIGDGEISRQRVNGSDST